MKSASARAGDRKSWPEGSKASTAAGSSPYRRSPVVATSCARSSRPVARAQSSTSPKAKAVWLCSPVRMG